MTIWKLSNSGLKQLSTQKSQLQAPIDDACASYFGGAVITDNSKPGNHPEIALPQDLTVLFHVPPQKAYTINSNVARLQTVKSLVEVAFEQAMDGKIWEALTLKWFNLLLSIQP